MLSILGVRSFGNVHQEVIRFNTPLTLIVGYNGSGKTTIIECLKYATTGELPPNSKQGAFIHDPKLCGEKEVLGQVKLGFTSTAQKPMIVTRSMQLTVQKTTRKFKTLECQLLINNDGERHSISSRVAELDYIMPQYFGVSEAILDSVIFCHQDESLWPMSEPTALKKKFDEIFEALKYTKAIENLKNLRKAKNLELGELKAYEIASKETKDKAERVRKRLEDLQRETDDLRSQKQSLTIQIDAAAVTVKEKHAQAIKAVGLVDDLKFKKDRARAIHEDIHDLRINLDELQESDEWLAATLLQYEDRMRQYEEQAEDFRAQYEDLQRTTADSRRQMSSKQAERGQQLAEKERYESQLQARVQLVKKASHRHAMRGYDGDLDDMQIRDFIDRTQKLSRDKDRELERVHSSFEEELKQSQSKITEIENHRSTKTNDKVTAKQQIALSVRKSKGIQQDLDLINMDEGTKTVAEDALRDVQNRLTKAVKDYEAAGWEGKIRTENNRLQELESESEKLREELVQNTRLAKDRAQLEFVKGQVKDRQRSLDTLKATYNDQLTSTLGAEWTLDTIEREYQTVSSQKARALEDAKREQEGAARELSEIQYKLNSLLANLREKKSLMKTCHDKVTHSLLSDECRPLTSIEDYEEEFKDLQKEYDEAQASAESVGFVIKYYGDCLETANGGHCRLCERPFLEKKEKSAAIAKINRLLAKFAQEDYKKVAEEMKQSLQTAIAARSQYDMYRSLSSEVPTIEKDISRVRNEKESLVSRLEQLDTLVVEEESTKNSTESLSKIVSTISRYRSEILGYESEISRISSQQKMSGSSRSIEEIDERNGQCVEQIRVLKNQLNKIISDRDHAKGAMSSMELELSTSSRDLDKATHQLEKKHRLVEQIEELRENSNHLQEVVATANTDLEALIPQLANAKAQHEEAQQRGRAKTKDIQGEKEKLSETVHEFKLVEDDINRYLDRDGPGKLAACQRAIKNLEQEQKRYEAESNGITARSNEIEKLISDGGRTKRSIEDNIKYRGSLKKLEALQNEIADLESRNVTDTHERLQREASNAEKRRETLLAERGPVIGSIWSKDEEIVRYLAEWDADYKDAGQKFREAHIKVETTKAAVEDLGKCMQAVDAAIMKYHSAKMEEINRVAGELWQSTYQGTDVDTILIRSEAEEGTKKRGYNYRVVMVKQDVEMDMRGRCSAGQKVLACIIIRLALAECFGVNCGIIALDEPTTNLDSDNIRALADSLHRIIKQRRQQANFQIIIITHDEDFLKQMRCQEFCDTYYRVSRNEKQKSVIERQSIEEVLRS